MRSPASSALIGAYRGAVTQKAGKEEVMPEGVLWQRNFWDTIVRGEQDLPRIRDYIHTNPPRWQEDHCTPLRHRTSSIGMA